MTGSTIGLVLGLDTGTSILNLGLARDGRLIGSASRPSSSHARLLPEFVAELLDSVRLKLVDLAGIAVGIGPGSFTGLRIGLSYAKGVALATGCPLVGVGSLDSLAICALDTPNLSAQLVCPVIDARRDQVYSAIYRVGPGGLERESEPRVIKLKGLLSEICDNVAFVGDSKAAEAAAAVNARGGVATVIGEDGPQARGGVIAAIGAARLASGEINAAATLEPLYVRPPDAKAAAQTAHKGSSETEDLWSTGRKSSSSSSQATTRN